LAKELVSPSNAPLFTRDKLHEAFQGVLNETTLARIYQDMKSRGKTGSETAGKETEMMIPQDEEE
jgi:hypothetical protein